MHPAGRRRRIISMKKSNLRAVGGFICVFVLTGCTVFGVRSGTEQPSYSVEESIAETVEIRRYEARVFAEARVDADTGNHRNAAFRLLFDYISGNNQATTKIAMTAPVTSASVSQEIAMTVPVTSDTQGDTYTMRFSLPKSFSLETAPVPNDPAVTVSETPPRHEAVLTFSGTTADDAVDLKKAELVTVLKQSGWTMTGAPVAYFYDPPWTLPPLKRNEVTVVVERRVN